MISVTASGTCRAREEVRVNPGGYKPKSPAYKQVSGSSAFNASLHSSLLPLQGLGRCAEKE